MAEHRVSVVVLLFLTFSALVANPKKTTLHGGQSRSWSAEQEKNNNKKSGSAPPPPPERCSFGEKKKNHATHPHLFIGATQVGVTQEKVVSVRLASVQGFLRLVS